MSTETAILTLTANANRLATFISDPDKGDKIVITDETIREGERTRVADLLIDLDFEAYEGDGPIVEVRRV